MAFKPGNVQKMPDLACIGLVKKVGDVCKKDEGVYHYIPIEIEAKYGGRSGSFYFLFQPDWFGKAFDPAVLLEKSPDGKLYGTYRRMINDQKRVAALVGLCGDSFELVSKAFDEAGDASPDQIISILREALTGRDVGYVCRQRKDKDEAGNRELTEFYNIDRFFKLDEESLQAIIEASENESRRTPLVVTWDQD